MKILALESSGTACSAALWGEEGLIAQSFQNSGLTHSRTLLPMVRDLLNNCGTGLLYRAAHRRVHRQGPGLGGGQGLRPLLHPGVHGLAPGIFPGRSHRLSHGRPAEAGL